MGERDQVYRGLEESLAPLRCRKRTPVVRMRDAEGSLAGFWILFLLDNCLFVCLFSVK